MRSESQNLARPQWEGKEAPALEERSIKEFVDMFLSENYSRKVGELALKNRLEGVPQMKSSDDPHFFLADYKLGGSHSSSQV